VRQPSSPLQALPKRLFKGDTLGVAAVSDPLSNNDMARFGAGVEFIERLGFKLRLGRYLSSKNPAERARDFNEFFLDPEIKGIIAAQGGDSAETLLEYIDWNAVRANPKIFMGFSDVTVLLNAMYAECGMATFHGGDVKFHYGLYAGQYDRREFTRRLVLGDGGYVEKDADALERKCVRAGRARGVLLGGNLRCLLKLSATRHWPDFTGAVLMLESYRITPEKCLEYFRELENVGVFDRIAGALVGYVYSMQADNPSGPQMEDIFKDFTSGYDFPILKINEFGHGRPNAILPVGGVVEMDAAEKSLYIVGGGVGGGGSTAGEQSC
jgi:muramoyltetrapeptide carboxypeptidase